MRPPKILSHNSVSLIFHFHFIFFRIDAEAIDLQLDYWTMDSPASGLTNLSSAGSGVSSNLTSITSSKLRGSDHSSSRTESKREGGKGSEVGIKYFLDFYILYY